MNKPLIACVQQQSPSAIATLDQGATLTNTYKRKALYCYKGFKAYQLFNTYWVEHGILLHSEFRDGSEHVHSTQKEGLAGGQLPSNLFGANAAWWAMMVLSL